jgi:hypothetical protein
MKTIAHCYRPKHIDSCTSCPILEECDVVPDFEDMRVKKISEGRQLAFEWWSTVNKP